MTNQFKKKQKKTLAKEISLDEKRKDAFLENRIDVRPGSPADLFKYRAVYSEVSLIELK